MTSSAAPIVHPPSLCFQLTKEKCNPQKFCILNPYPLDVHFKVDLPEYGPLQVSSIRGIIGTRQKFTIEVECDSSEVFECTIQIRFYRWSQPRQGQPRPQKYLGFREVLVSVKDELNKKESVTGSQATNRNTSEASSALEHEQYQFNDDIPSESTIQVAYKIFLAVVLLICGALVDKYLDDLIIMETITSHTLAIILYTLATVLIIQLLTSR